MRITSTGGPWTLHEERLVSHFYDKFIYFKLIPYFKRKGSNIFCTIKNNLNILFVIFFI